MTVCIAARCETPSEDQCIVTVSDTKLTTGSYSTEFATLKLRILADRWVGLISGAFADHVPLVHQIQRRIAELKATPTCEQVGEICTAAFIAENKRLAEESVLASYGLTLEGFLKSRAVLGDSIFERLWGDIARIKTGCQLLICGFGPESLGHILTVDNPHSERSSFVTSCDFPGFAAIGSGMYSAESALYALEHHPTASLEQTICTVLFAKFSAESASDVGEETYVKVLANKSNIKIESIPELAREVRKQWKRHGKMRLPNKALSAITERVREVAKSSDVQT